MYNVSSSPHVKSKVTTQSIMRDVIIALMPATIFGIYNYSHLFGAKYGLRSALLIILTVVACVLSEYVFEKITKRESTLDDLSAVVTGMILALNLPCTFPYWKAMLGGFFAIVIVKQLFGGLGQNFMNPALGARCFLVLSFAGNMTAFYPTDVSGVDAATSATPLTSLKNTGDSVASLADMFIGNHSGTIGETCIIALLIGVVYLVVRKIIDLRIPLTYIAVFAVCIMLFNKSTDPCFLSCKTSLRWWFDFWSLFMATDYTTSPITKTGKIYFWYMFRSFDSYFQNIWKYCRRRFICNYILQSFSSIIENGQFQELLELLRQKEGK